MKLYSKESKNTEILIVDFIQKDYIKKIFFLKQFITLRIFIKIETLNIL